MKDVITHLLTIATVCKESLDFFRKSIAPLRNNFFGVKIDSDGHIIGYLRPDTGAKYCSMSVSHFKSLLKSNDIPSKVVSEKVTLIRIQDIDDYIERKAKENTK